MVDSSSAWQLAPWTCIVTSLSERLRNSSIDYRKENTPTNDAEAMMPYTIPLPALCQTGRTPRLRGLAGGSATAIQALPTRYNQRRRQGRVQFHNADKLDRLAGRHRQTPNIFLASSEMHYTYRRSTEEGGNALEMHP